MTFFEENPHFRGKSLSKHPETKSVIFALLKHLYLNTLLYIKLYQLIKDLNICAEGLLIKVDFLYELRW